jgi:hypothetical protein
VAGEEAAALMVCYLMRLFGYKKNYLMRLVADFSEEDECLN